MAYFAVSCRHGFNAFQLKEVIERIFPEAVKEKIKAIVSPVAFIQKKIADGKVKRTVKELGGGYIYLQIDTDDETMPVEVFKRLKELPWVTQTLREDIPADEVEAFCHNVGLQLEESEIVLEVESVHEEMIQTLVQDINRAETLAERKEAEGKLDNELANPTCGVEKAKAIQNHDAKAVLVRVKKKRGRTVGEIRISLGLIIKAVKEMEQRTGRKVSKEQLQSETFLLELLYQHFQLKKDKNKDE